MKAIIFDFDGVIAESYMQPIAVTVDFIKQYEGSVKFAIASMSPAIVIETFIKHFGIRNKIYTITSTDEVLHLKPDPEVYLKTRQKLSLPPEECIAIEDTYAGASAAIAANIPCYGFLNSYNDREMFDDVSLAGFIQTRAELESLVKSA